ncbi:EmrB/QacA family drug resistance transporter [Thermobifida fusca TM51]|jgi:EmrB/QacA subfamily drug resistance transporter|uniref:EmrB/QacA family drug resistance transporter n=1 Tax=Thermobifida fusca TM51 TaxID=1169414 RepID=A0A9P2WPY4_THEFU|nr:MULTISPECIES: MDR family MFS transporter [Thermobifida]EOR69933.1 EmrB/QacA family drug resistance transporter [Thermobifida fusca TM51]MBO2530072.1 MFS transporter [Thermobifida sp.]PPS94955.1 MFS transporter [Thermobifida fusca]PZN65703.1 MAG: MFS transporter [Thermobifida fusca]QOS59452.1 MFS transporter [Thermobifida fusca]
MTVPARSDSSETSPAPITRRSVVLIFLALMLAMLLASLNQTVLSTALPTMVGELNGVDQMLWVMTAFILASTIMMPIYGKLGDLIGRKGLFLAAISLFIAGSVIGGLAPTMDWLIAGRVVQGLGGGGLMIMSQAIIADIVPARQRGRYAGFIGAVFAVSSVAGPLLGGWFTEGIGWRWAFWINIPLGLLALAAAAFLLRLPRPRPERLHVDAWGMAFLAAATTCLILTSTWGGSQYAWNSPVIIGLILGTVVSSALFILAEHRAAEPIIPLHLFRDRTFVLTTVAGLLTGLMMFGILGYVPTYVQMATGTEATVAGLLMTPMMGGLLVTSIGTGQFVSRTGRYKWIPVGGSLIVTAGLLLLSTVTPTTPIWAICGYLVVVGIGLGSSMQLLVLMVQNAFPLSQVGTATAANNFFRQIGASLGSAIVGSLFTVRLMDFLTERLPGGAALPSGGTTSSLTPELVHRLPDSLRQVVIDSYNDALIPLFLVLSPLGLVAAALLTLVKEKPLATTIERD